MPPIKCDAEQKSANININKTIEIEKNKIIPILRKSQETTGRVCVSFRFIKKTY